MGSVVIAVVHSGLNPFTQALVIGIVSATIGALGMVVSAIISARAQQRVIDTQKTVVSHLEDVKGAVGAKHRSGDKKREGE